MKQTRPLMGMPITVEIVDASVTPADLEKVYQYFTTVDRTFSTYKPESEISCFNRGEVAERDLSPEVQEVLRLCEATKRLTGGFFDICNRKGIIDPSGLVKGWAIRNAATLIADAGFRNFYVEAGGDIQMSGKNSDGGSWRVGIRSPFRKEEIVKVVYPEGKGIATSGTYIRGQHIYSPFAKDREITEIVSLTVIGPDVYEADRYATAIFAMGKTGIAFLEKLKGFEGYMIDATGIATMTSGFDSYTCLPHDE
ncbi:MAG: FAD:protein FMN transferase [Candidatus Peregrinibacteria bacterium]